MIPEAVIRKAVAANLPREGPKRNMSAGLTDPAGQVTDWEESGPDWRRQMLCAKGQKD